MNDPSSFESDGSWVFPQDDGKIRVVMQSRGKNAFGAISFLFVNIEHRYYRQS